MLSREGQDVANTGSSKIVCTNVTVIYGTPIVYLVPMAFYRRGGRVTRVPTSDGLLSIIYVFALPPRRSRIAFGEDTLGLACMPNGQIQEALHLRDEIPELTRHRSP